MFDRHNKRSLINPECDHKSSCEIPFLSLCLSVSLSRFSPSLLLSLPLSLPLSQSPSLSLPLSQSPSLSPRSLILSFHLAIFLFLSLTPTPDLHAHTIPLDFPHTLFPPLLLLSVPVCLQSSISPQPSRRY